jgi:hypothetical protein
LSGLRSGGTDVQVLIIVFRRFREIEFVDPEDTHSMELRVRKEGKESHTAGSFGIRTIIKAQQLTVNIQTS